MYTATCSVEGCDHEVMDQDFDRVADAMTEHHEQIHGEVPTKIATWKREKAQEPQAA